MTTALPPDVTAVVAEATDVALTAAAIADEFTLPRFLARDFTIDWKHNATEVTEIDRAAERLIVDVLVGSFGDHLVVGEEHGRSGAAASPWRWLVDPIDGTSGFVRGIPIWATLIGLVHADHGPLLGVVSAPALGRRWWGAVGDDGTHTAAMSGPGGSRALGVSEVDDLSDAQVNVTLSTGWRDAGLLDALVGIELEARRSRGVGDFWQHMLVAEGAMDVAVDAVGVEDYDIAACAAIVRAAGGRFTDRFGADSLRAPGASTTTAISSNGLLHDEVINRLAAVNGPNGDASKRTSS